MNMIRIWRRALNIYEIWVQIGANCIIVLGIKFQPMRTFKLPKMVSLELKKGEVSPILKWILKKYWQIRKIRWIRSYLWWIFIVQMHWSFLMKKNKPILIWQKNIDSMMIKGSKLLEKNTGMKDECLQNYRVLFLNPN